MNVWSPEVTTRFLLNHEVAVACQDCGKLVNFKPIAVMASEWNDLLNEHEVVMHIEPKIDTSSCTCHSELMPMFVKAKVALEQMMKDFLDLRILANDEPARSRPLRVRA